MIRWCGAWCGVGAKKEGRQRKGNVFKERERERESDERHYSLGGQHSFEREILREQSTMMYFKLWIICGGEDNTTLSDAINKEGHIICSS